LGPSKSKVQAVIYEALDIETAKKNILFNEHPHFAGQFPPLFRHLGIPLFPVQLQKSPAARYS